MTSVFLHGQQAPPQPPSHPTRWGPPQWQLMYSIAANRDPAVNGQALAAYYEHLRLVLPCTQCRASWADKLHAYPAPIREPAGSRAWFDWVYQMQLEVAQTTRRPMRDSLDTLLRRHQMVAPTRKVAAVPVAKPPPVTPRKLPGSVQVPGLRRAASSR